MLYNTCVCAVHGHIHDVSGILCYDCSYINKKATMNNLEKYGSTFLGRLLDKKAKNRKLEKELDKIADETCTCSINYQVIGCSAYKHKTCIWHPENEPYDLQNREWVRGKGLVKRKRQGKT